MGRRARFSTLPEEVLGGVRGGVDAEQRNLFAHEVAGGFIGDWLGKKRATPWATSGRLAKFKRPGWIAIGSSAAMVVNQWLNRGQND